MKLPCLFKKEKDTVTARNIHATERFFINGVQCELKTRIVRNADGTGTTTIHYIGAVSNEE